MTIRQRIRDTLARVAAVACPARAEPAAVAVAIGREMTLDELAEHYTRHGVVGPRAAARAALGLPDHPAPFTHQTGDTP